MSYTVSVFPGFSAAAHLAGWYSAYKKRAAVCGAPVGKDVLSNTHFSGIEQVGTAVIVAGNIPVIGIDPGQDAFGITAI